MKKKLLVTLSALFVIFLILFLIQIIDQKVNGEDYKKISKYTNDIGSYIQKSYCYQDIIEVLSANQENNLTNNQDTINRDIKDCQELRKKIIDTPLPELKLKQKQEIIELFKNDLINIAELGTTYYYSYINNSDTRNIDLIIEQANYLTKRSNLHLRELMLTYSIKHIIIIRPMLIYTGTKVKSYYRFD